MKNQLALCSLALNPTAPSPTANMVKIEDGFMIAYGGMFCISVPMKVEVGACFNPGAVANFFRKERKAVSYTVQKGKLILQEGKERLSVPCLAPEEMVTLDALGDAEEVEMDLTHFKSLMDIIEPAASRIMLQGISLRNGMMESSNGAVVISALSGLPDELEFNLPHASCKALSRFKSQVIAVTLTQQALKFHFKDGSSLTSLGITDQLTDTSRFFEGEWKSIKLKPEVAADILTLECDGVVFEEGAARYFGDNRRGEISDVVSKSFAVTTGKSSLDALLRVSSDIRLSEDNFRLMAVAPTCRAVAATRTHPSS